MFGAMAPLLAVLLIALMVSSLIQPLVNTISVKWQKDGFLVFIRIAFNGKGFGEKGRKDRKKMYDMKHMGKNFWFWCILP